MSKAISAMHHDPSFPWTLQELARQVGMSRTAFAQRFRERVGETPITYLTRWRMTLAGEKLTHSHDTVAQVAASFGYTSEHAFNTAFKRTMGCSPRRYARQAADQLTDNGAAREIDVQQPQLTSFEQHAD